MTQWGRGAQTKTWGLSREQVYTLNTVPHIYFSRPDSQDSKKLTNYLNSPNHTKIIYLLNPSYNFNVFQFIDRTFTITTKTGTYKFNVDLLTDTSPIISEILKQNPSNLQYQLNNKDDENVMSKVEQLYQGQAISLTSNEQYIFKLISEELNITKSLKSTNPPGFIGNRQNTLGSYQITPNNFYCYLKETFPKTFTIATKSKEYMCNIIGVNSSKILHELLIKDPSLNRYEYDYDDECNEFQSICNFFNFNMVPVTADNMNSFKEIAEELQIDFILNDIDSFINDYESRVQTLDDQQSMIDSIDELFETLYKIKEITVESAKVKIVESFWSKTEEDVQELAAFILQVIRTDFLLHPYIADLILSLDKESDESNELKILVPLIISKLMQSFGKYKTMNSFIYILHQKGLISEEEIKEKINDLFNNKKTNNNNNAVRSGFTSSSLGALKTANSNKSISDSNLLFLPEIFEFLNSDLNLVKNYFSQSSKTFIDLYLPDKIEDFKKMRESGEPDDPITKALRSDDVDTFQSIITKSQIDMTKATVPFNLYEEFVPNGETNYINYAAAYGSVKCFKYLLLNQANVDKSTFTFAVFSGNTEIVKIIDQKLSEISETPLSKPVPKPRSLFGSAKKPSFNVEQFVPAIKKHESNLFNWIIEQKYPDINQNEKLMLQIVLIASENGDAHSIATLVDKGSDFSFLNKINVTQIIGNATINGFYRVLVFITNIMQKKIDQLNERNAVFNPTDSVSFGNLSIFNLCCEKANKQFRIDGALSSAVKLGYKKIIEYIFDNGLIEEKSFSIFGSFYSILGDSIQLKTDDIFNYIIQKIKEVRPNSLNNLNKINLLSEACFAKKVEISKKITDLIIELRKDDKTDFSLPFFNAAVAGSAELCQYFIDQKVSINFKLILMQVKKLSSVNKDVLDIIIQNIPPQAKELLNSCYLGEVIRIKNKNFIEHLLKENSIYNNALFDAVTTNDIEIVNLILDHKSDPAFINQTSLNGTALNIAVKNQNIEIVKRLLSIPGIDPNLYERNNNTPLITAIDNLDIEMMNAILDFYGPKIKSQSWQLDEAVKRFLNKLSSEKRIEERKNRTGNTWGSKLRSTQQQGQLARPVNRFGWGNRTLKSPQQQQQKQQQEVSNDDSKFLSVLNRLLEIEGIDLNCHADNYTLFSYACEANEIDIVDMMLGNPKVDVNSYSQLDGNTPLLIAIDKQNFEIVKLLIESDRININLRNYERETALLMAVRKDLVEVVDLIINNKKFNPVESCLDHAFYISNGECSKKLITLKDLDVNYKYVFPIDSSEKGNAIKSSSFYGNRERSGFKLDFTNTQQLKLFSTPLISAVQSNKIEFIDLIINHPSFNGEKSLINDAVFMACLRNRVEIFRKLIKLVDNGFDLKDEAGRSLLDISIGTNANKIVAEILNSPDYVVNDIVELFTYCLTRDPPLFEIMDELLQYDKNHDKLIDLKANLPNGCSFFTFTYRYDESDIEQIVNYLIQNGADPNLPDQSGYYPLEYAIMINWERYVNALIETGKIDFSIRLKQKTSQLPNVDYPISETSGKTYLHLAAAGNSSEILQNLLLYKAIDINATDSKGETPLMEACRAQNVTSISLLFENDDLDYLHKNNDGEDALKITQKITNEKEIKETPKTKEEYMVCLINMLSFKKNSKKKDDESEKGSRQSWGSKSGAGAGPGPGWKTKSGAGWGQKSKPWGKQVTKNTTTTTTTSIKPGEDKKEETGEDKKEEPAKESSIGDGESSQEATENSKVEKEEDTVKNTSLESGDLNQSTAENSTTESDTKTAKEPPITSGTGKFGQSAASKTTSGFKNLSNTSNEKPSFGTHKFGQSTSESSATENDSEPVKKPSFGTGKFGQSATTKAAFGFKNLSNASNEKHSFGTHKFGQSTSESSATELYDSEPIKKPSFGTGKFGQSPISRFQNESKQSNDSLETPSNDDSLIQDEISALILDSLENVTPEQVQKISKGLSLIAEKRMKKSTDSYVQQQNSEKEAENETKNKHVFKFRKSPVEEDKKMVEQRPTLQFRKELERIDREVDDQNQFNFGQNASYQDQVFQNQWSQMLQMNNMRNAQFNMIMQQQQMMMYSLGNPVNDSSSKKSKKKKKSHK